MTDMPQVPHPQVDWRTLEDSLLRRALKAQSFRELYGGRGSAKRAPLGSVTGRMSIKPPAYHPVHLRCSDG